MKSATLLILIFNFLLFSLVREFYETRYQSGSFSLLKLGNGFSCLRSFLFFTFQDRGMQMFTNLLQEMGEVELLAWLAAPHWMGYAW